MAKTIYIADCNEDFRRQLSDYLLKRTDYTLIGGTSSGRTAISEIVEKRPDVLITDLLLSDFDGYAVMDEIRRNELNTEVYVVSALNKDAFINKALTMGAKYYMVKPVDFDTLFLRVNQHANVVRTSVNKSLEEKISNIFISVGIPAHIKGYQFLREAIKMAIEKPEIVNSITKQLYPSIADRFDTSASKVERAIRHAIEVAWNKGKIDNINNLFGVKVYSPQDKPTNGEFIALVADKMLIEGV